MADPLISDIVLKLCKKAGLTDAQIDVSLLTDENMHPSSRCAGYCIQRNTVAAEALKILMTAYFFDACETGGKIKFVPRGMNVIAMDIPEADLGLIADKAELVSETIAQEQDLPQQLTVLFNSAAIDYQQGKQMKQRSTRAVNTRNQTTISLPITLTDDQARQIAEVGLFLAWLERDALQFNLWRSVYMRLDPTDVITFTYKGDLFEIRISDNTIGQGMLLALGGVNSDARNYLSHIPGAIPKGFTPTPPRIAGDSTLFLFDIPLLRDADSNPQATGYYYGMGSSVIDWNGGVLDDSLDNADFVEVDTDFFPISYGYALDVLGNPATPFDWDNVNQLRIRMVSGSLTSDTADNLISKGANALIVGDPATQKFEVLQFQNAEQQDDGTYIVSLLARGRRGTEWACGFWGDFANGQVTHAAGDLVVLAQSGMKRIQEPLPFLNVLRYYKAVTIGQDPSAVDSQQFTDTGNDLRPYAPIKIGGTIDSNQNVILTWARRTRVGGTNALDPDSDPTDTALPLSEDSLAFEIDIKSAGDLTVLRTIKTSSMTANYPLDQQTTDFGAAVTTLIVDVYQISAEIGRGFKGHAVIDLTLPPPITPPAAGPCPCGTIYVNLN